MGMLPAAVLGVASFAALNGNASTARGIGGFAAAVLAAPALLAFGVPLASGSSRILLGAALSAALWFLIGAFAAGRATRSPVATWRDFWREFLWLAGGVWLGVIAALAVVEVAVGSALI